MGLKECRLSSAHVFEKDNQTVEEGANVRGKKIDLARVGCCTSAADLWRESMRTANQAAFYEQGSCAGTMQAGDW